ncbi:MAG: hypothetical protein J6U96_04665 [Elusimicrobiaceae bacterium]|nr:hypothetical protein [Elusimicrobiaceae bacterium]
MPKVTKLQVKQCTDEIKYLMLSGKDFAQPLAQLYTQLRLQAKYEWLVEVYQLLLLYANDAQISCLYHSALLQALLQLGYAQEAQQIGQTLLKQNPADPETRKLLQSVHMRKETALPAYTALAVLSKYTSACTHKIIDTLPAQWQDKLAALSPEKLTTLGYYKKQKQLARAPKPYREILHTDFDELTLCYLFQLDRAVVAVAGALLETLLALHLQQKYKFNRITSGGQRKKVFDLSLHELLHIYSQKNILSPSVLHLCRAARAQRNFIHPGKELAEKNSLGHSSRQICFLAVMEVIDALL